MAEMHHEMSIEDMNSLNIHLGYFDGVGLLCITTNPLQFKSHKSAFKTFEIDISNLNDRILYTDGRISLENATLCEGCKHTG